MQYGGGVHHPLVAVDAQPEEVLGAFRERARGDLVAIERRAARKGTLGWVELRPLAVDGALVETDGAA